jgi:membrane associated rhomboid family serine protease
VSTRLRFWESGQHDLVTKALVAVNVAVFVGAIVLGGASIMGAGRWHDLGGLRALSWRYTANGEVFRGVVDGAWWRLVTSGFLHYGVIHIAMNMYVLWVVGPSLERELGHTRFFLVYLASLLGGSAGALLLSPNNLTVGASGAIFGLFGAFATGLWQRGVNPFRTGIGTTLLINLALTFGLSSYISVGGHLGGLVAGAICGWFLLVHPARRQPTWTYLVPIAVSGVAVGVALWAAQRA